jgi:hypothetical protein
MTKFHRRYYCNFFFSSIIIPWTCQKATCREFYLPMAFQFVTLILYVCSIYKYVHPEYDLQLFAGYHQYIISARVFFSLTTLNTMIFKYNKIGRTRENFKNYESLFSFFRPRKPCHSGHKYLVRQPFCKKKNSESWNLDECGRSPILG